MNTSCIEFSSIFVNFEVMGDYFQIPVTNTRKSRKLVKTYLENDQLNCQCVGDVVWLRVHKYRFTFFVLGKKFQLEKRPFFYLQWSKNPQKPKFSNLILQSIRVTCMKGTSAFKRRRKDVAFLQLGEAKSHKRKPWWIWYDCNHDSKVINKYHEW